MVNYMDHTETKSMHLVNPFPGLRPFSTSDSQVFFGREKQVDEIVKHLMKSRFAAITGSPGTGKTSVALAGVIPALMYQGEWILFRTRPGITPLQDLYASIMKKLGNPSTGISSGMLPSTEDMLSNLNNMHREYQAGILIVVDQFEEIFTRRGVLSEPNHKTNRDQYLDFLMKAFQQQKVPIYILITIRSDFLDEFSAYRDFSDLIDSNNYPLPAMNAESIGRTIRGPLEVAGVGIEKELVRKIVEDVQENPDLLPVLQHALMKTWYFWSLRGQPDTKVSLEDYEQIGSINHAISKYADEAYSQLNEEEKDFCQRIFRALSRRDAQNRDICLPQTIAKISGITQVPAEKVIRVIEPFRREGRGFIVTQTEGSLNQNSVISISHELLMSLWYRLDEWADEEYESVQMYLRLAEDAELYQTGKAELWRPPDLELALEWYNQARPTPAWAERYNPAFERTIVFLKTSEQEFAMEEEEKFQAERRKRVVNRIITAALAVAVLIAVIIFSLQRSPKISPANQVLSDNEVPAVNQSAGQATGQTSDIKSRPVPATDQPEEEERNQNAETPVTGDNGTKENTQQNNNVAGRQEVSSEETTRKSAGEQEATKAKKPSEVPATEMASSGPAVEQPPVSESASQTTENNPVANNPESDGTLSFSPERIQPVIASLASQALKLKGEPDLSALLAYQSFLFNKDYNQAAFDASIYTALYNAVKTFRGQNYNAYRGHSQIVRTLDFLPGSPVFFSGGSDGTIMRWNLEDNQKRHSDILTGRNVIDVIRVTPNGKWLLFAENNTGLSVINLSGGNLITDLMRGEEKNIRTIAVASDNNTVYSAGLGNFIEEWNITLRSAEKRITTESRVNSLAVTPNGRTLAGGLRNGNIVVWNLSGDIKPRTIHSEAGNAVQTLRFSPDGRYLACGTLNGSILIFGTGNFKRVATLKGHEARVTSLAFRPDGKFLASASYDGSVRLWDLMDYASQPVVMKDNAGFVFSVAFSSNGRYFVSGSADEPRLVARPAEASVLASQVCPLVKRDMSREEWNTYVGEDIPYQATCSGSGQ